MTHLPRHIVGLVAALFCLVHASAFAAEAPGTLEDRWYIMQLGGKPSGWMHESVIESADKRELTTRGETEISIRRGPTKITITVKSEFVETADGKPLRATTTTAMGKMNVVQKLTFKPDGIDVETTQGDQVTRSTHKLPAKKWLPPAAAGRYVEEQVKKGEKKITVVTLDPSAGLEPFTMEMQLLEKENVEVLGKVVPATAVDMTVSQLPGVVSRQYISEAGEMVKMTMSPIPGFDMTVLLADKDLAKAQVDPPEMLASTLIEMKTPIKDPRNLKRAVYELKFAEQPPVNGKPVPSPDLPKAGFQKVIWGDERTAKVIVDLKEPTTPGDDLPKKEHREASAALNSDDPKIKELVTEALGKDSEKLSDKEKAEKLRKFVFKYINKKDLSVGFAFAGEVARTKQGDCTEHGVLLAALLRAAGIPSRTASGLIYIDEFAGKKNIFGYHMWAQAWLSDGKTGGHWVDLDGTLPEPGYDAAHITLSVSAMSDGGNDMMELVGVIGRLEIKVVETK